MRVSWEFLCAPNIGWLFGVSFWMTWREECGSRDALTLAKGMFPMQGSASVSAIVVSSFTAKPVHHKLKTPPSLCRTAT